MKNMIRKERYFQLFECTYDLKIKYNIKILISKKKKKNRKRSTFCIIGNYFWWGVPLNVQIIHKKPLVQNSFSIRPNSQKMRLNKYPRRQKKGEVVWKKSLYPPQESSSKWYKRIGRVGGSHRGWIWEILNGYFKSESNDKLILKKKSYEKTIPSKVQWYNRGVY